jgi:hypothetical protein
MSASLLQLWSPQPQKLQVTTKSDSPVRTLRLLSGSGVRVIRVSAYARVQVRNGSC